MDVSVRQSTVAGTARAPPSKSYSHRAILAAGYGEGARISDPLVSADTRATARAVDLEEDLRELAEATAATLGIPWLGVDILSTEGRAVVSETNARPTIDDAEKYDAGFWDEVAALVRKRALQD